MPLSPPQKNLLIIYVPLTVLFGTAFFLLHWLLHIFGLEPQGLMMYGPIIFIAAVLIYWTYFRHKVRQVNYKGVGPVTVATVYFFSMLTIPWVGLNWAAATTDHVEELGSIQDIPQARSPFIHFRKFDARPERFIDDLKSIESKDDDGFTSFNFEYRALVPLVNSPYDTTFMIWLEINDWKSVEHDLSVAELKKYEDDLILKNRSRVSTYPYDSIRFFTISDVSPHISLLQKHKQTTTGQIILHASLEPLTEYRLFSAQLFFWIYFGLSLFFLGAVVLGHYKEIVTDD